MAENPYAVLITKFIVTLSFRPNAIPVFLTRKISARLNLPLIHPLESKIGLDLVNMAQAASVNVTHPAFVSAFCVCTDIYTSYATS